jgi:hypothetical protein
MDGYEIRSSFVAEAKAPSCVSGRVKSPWRMVRPGRVAYSGGRREGSRTERIREDGGMCRVVSRCCRTSEPRPPVADVIQSFSLEGVVVVVVVVVGGSGGYGQFSLGAHV